ncbi:hypothetical protein HDV57DRAFT_137148 [Trichoderma longibrachiatum]
MKFGKQIQKRQLEVPEYAASFVNYKALKKVSSHSFITQYQKPLHLPISLVVYILFLSFLLCCLRKQHRRGKLIGGASAQASLYLHAHTLWLSPQSLGHTWHTCTPPTAISRTTLG